MCIRDRARETTGEMKRIRNGHWFDEKCANIIAKKVNDREKIFKEKYELIMKNTKR